MTANSLVLGKYINYSLRATNFLRVDYLVGYYNKGLMYCNIIADNSHKDLTFCAIMNLKLKPNENCQSIQSQRFSTDLKFHSTGEGSKWWFDCHDSIATWWYIIGFNIILRQLLVENQFYNAQCSAFPWQHILHVEDVLCAVAVGSKQGNRQSAFQKLKLFHGQWSSFFFFFMAENEMKRLMLGWLRVSLESRGPCGVN